MLPGIARCSFLSPNPLQKKKQEEGLPYSPISSSPFGEAEKKSGHSNIMGEGRKAYLCMRGVACNGVVVVIEQVC